MADYIAELDAIQLLLNGEHYASADSEDRDVATNARYEGVFLRAFTAFERTLEEVFLHFATGGASLGGYQPVCRLANCTEAQVRAILKGSQRFIDWANPQSVRDRADLFFEDGEPFRTGIDPRTQTLSDIQKLRNMIAHDSSESGSAYRDVQVSNFKTERPFPMSPGQLLRTRRKGPPVMHWCAHYIATMAATVEAIARKA